jgi:hypothetical protein
MLLHQQNTAILHLVCESQTNNVLQNPYYLGCHIHKNTFGMKAVKQETRIHTSLVLTNNASFIMIRLQFWLHPPITWKL